MQVHTLIEVPLRKLRRASKQMENDERKRHGIGIKTGNSFLDHPFSAIFSIVSYGVVVTAHQLFYSYF